MTTTQEALAFFKAHSEWLAENWSLSPEGRAYKAEFDLHCAALSTPARVEAAGWMPIETALNTYSKPYVFTPLYTHPPQAGTPPAQPAPQAQAEGAASGALAMRVLQSDLYQQLDDLERAQCDALISGHLATLTTPPTPSEPAQPAQASTQVPVGMVIFDKVAGCKAGQLFEDLPISTKLYASPVTPEGPTP